MPMLQALAGIKAAMAGAALSAVALLAMAGAGRCQAINSPGGAPPGYYPGVANGVPAFQHEQWRRWAHARKPAILALWARIKAAKASGTPPGCIGRSAEDCIVTLAQDLALADDYMSATLLDKVQFDVNGEPIYPKMVEIYAFLPSRQGAQQAGAQTPYLQNRHAVFLRLAKGKVVKIVLVDITNGLLRARTAAQYDQTAVYEVLAPLTRRHCPQLSRLRLYRFIENTLRPAARRARALGAARSYIATKSSPAMAFCGRRLTFEIELDRSKWPHHEAQISTQLVIR